jgi:hypothetical protein
MSTRNEISHTLSAYQARVNQETISSSPLGCACDRRPLASGLTTLLDETMTYYHVVQVLPLIPIDSDDTQESSLCDDSTLHTLNDTYSNT